MKTVDIQETNLDACVLDAQSDRVVITRGGNPVLLVVGVRGTPMWEPNSARVTTFGN